MQAASPTSSTGIAPLEIETLQAGETVRHKGPVIVNCDIPERVSLIISHGGIEAKGTVGTGTTLIAVGADNNMLPERLADLKIQASAADSVKLTPQAIKKPGDLAYLEDSSYGQMLAPLAGILVHGEIADNVSVLSNGMFKFDKAGNALNAVAAGHIEGKLVGAGSQLHAGQNINLIIAARASRLYAGGSVSLESLAADGQAYAGKQLTMQDTAMDNSRLFAGTQLAVAKTAQNVIMQAQDAKLDVLGVRSRLFADNSAQIGTADVGTQIVTKGKGQVQITERSETCHVWTQTERPVVNAGGKDVQLPRPKVPRVGTPMRAMQF